MLWPRASEIATGTTWALFDKVLWSHVSGVDAGKVNAIVTEKPVATSIEVNEVSSKLSLLPLFGVFRPRSYDGFEGLYKGAIATRSDQCPRISHTTAHRVKIRENQMFRSVVCTCDTDVRSKLISGVMKQSGTRDRDLPACVVETR